MALFLSDRQVVLHRRQVVAEGQPPTMLTAREASLLATLAQTPNKPVSRDDILTYVWGVTSDAPTRAVDVLVSRLRKKLEIDPSKPRHLLTEHGYGYRLQLSVPEGGGVSPASWQRRVVAWGNISVDLDGQLVMRDGRTEDLTALETKVLSVLVEANGAVVSRSDILRLVWNRRTESRALDHTVRRLRTKLDDPNGKIVVTLRGVGLRLAATTVSAEPPKGREGRCRGVGAGHVAAQLGDVDWACWGRQDHPGTIRPGKRPVL